MARDAAATQIGSFMAMYNALNAALDLPPARLEDQNHMTVGRILEELTERVLALEDRLKQA